MNIEIWGDSWGVPNHTKPIEGFTPEGHLEFRLRKDGHIVLNLAENSVGNLYSIQRSTNTSNIWNTDCVIWFHTDLGRDIPSTQIPKKSFLGAEYWEPNEALKEVAIKTYSLAKSTLGDTPVIVIEGQNYTLEPYFTDLLPNAYLIPKVVNRLTGIESIPSTQLLYQVYNTKKMKIKWKIR